MLPNNITPMFSGLPAGWFGVIDKEGRVAREMPVPLPEVCSQAPLPTPSSARRAPVGPLPSLSRLHHWATSAGHVTASACVLLLS